MDQRTACEERRRRSSLAGELLAFTVRLADAPETVLPVPNDPTTGPCVRCSTSLANSS
ncbi:hypothetical protein [Halorussus caseinilyticus]|uniref:hypothetical protein n=1 Tax=Halorussus caseinilyticus TaxID=3034025 RepID=UPI0023E83654|nr:hypothetical protein [Halorussus sp. DT72]